MQLQLSNSWGTNWTRASCTFLTNSNQQGKFAVFCWLGHFRSTFRVCIAYDATLGMSPFYQYDIWMDTLDHGSDPSSLSASKGSSVGKGFLWKRVIWKSRTSRLCLSPTYLSTLIRSQHRAPVITGCSSTETSCLWVSSQVEGSGKGSWNQCCAMLAGLHKTWFHKNIHSYDFSMG